MDTADAAAAGDEAAGDEDVTAGAGVAAVVGYGAGASTEKPFASRITATIAYA